MRDEELREILRGHVEAQDSSVPLCVPGGVWIPSEGTAHFIPDEIVLDVVAEFHAAGKRRREFERMLGAWDAPASDRTPM